MNIFQRVPGNSIILKVFFIGLLVLLLLIPVSKIEQLISERKARQFEAISEVTKKWGGSQVIVSPVLTIPFRKYVVEVKNKIRKVRIERSLARFLPEKVDIETEVLPEVRYRGIFDVVLYRAVITIKGHFSKPDLNEIKVRSKDLFLKEAYLGLGISDMRGIAPNTKLKWNGRTVSLKPDPAASSLYETGIRTKLSNFRLNRKNEFSLTLQIQGSENLQFIPVGKETKLRIKSTWPHPNFVGNYLPDKRKITAEGFSAAWKISYFGRNLPQEWRQDESSSKILRNYSDGSAFGVNFFLPVDAYQKSTRAIKYALLFIILTFAAFFIFEILSKMRIHPFQYLLIGFALSLFYLLFVSISEHINFIISYVISSVAVVALITGYSIKVLQGRSKALLLGSLLTGLYSYIFVLLQSEDSALLLGSVALFVVLSVIMYVTRNINWYELNLKRAEQT